MAYKSLQKLFNEDMSNARFERNKEEALRRRKDLSAFATGIMLDTGELFFTVPRELSVLTEKVLRLERRVSQLWRSLPRIAQRSYFYDLISTEIVSSNEIEGIRSTRRQIEEALESVVSDKSGAKEKKFFEFANLYLSITESETTLPKRPEDIRLIYDRIVSGFLDEKDKPDGNLFRAQSVNIYAGNTRLVHTGVSPEAKIVEMINALLDLVHSDEIPDIYSAVLSHFLFEYIHPFYDGNGRTGRYLLALFLSRPLSVVTVLSLSRTIIENISIYYNAFQEVEAATNHADATPFLLAMVGLIRKAQEDSYSELQQKMNSLKEGENSISNLNLGNEKLNDILSCLLQNDLFAISPATELRVIESFLQRSYMTTRKYLAELESRRLVRSVTLRPLRFVLSDEARKLFNLS